MSAPAPEVPPAPRLSLQGISKSFPGVRALHDVSLALYPGQVTALPSGHDAWVIGDEPAVMIDWWGASNYAKA